MSRYFRTEVRDNLPSNNNDNLLTLFNSGPMDEPLPGQSYMAVTLGTANFVKPGITVELVEGIKTYMLSWGTEDFGSLTGTAHAG